MAKEKFQKYIISLDAVDANLLPINHQFKFEDVAPLWTTNNLNMRNNDYYEFEIKNVDTKYEDDEENEILNIPCHICDIDVPVPFLKQHQDSFKHIVNMKIADTAMERIKKSMHYYHGSSEDTYPNLHFCPACVTVVKLKDKTKHEKSLIHTNSMIVNKFLNDFYLLYTNSTNCNIDLDQNLNKLDDQEVIKSSVINDNVDQSMDSVSFTSATDSSSIFKDNCTDMSDRTKNRTNAESSNSDIVKINKKNKGKIKNHNNTTNMLPTNVSNNVGDKSKQELFENRTSESASRDLSSSVSLLHVIKTDDTKKKKANGAITQDTDLLFKDASKKISEVIRAESDKQKIVKTQNQKEITIEIKHGKDKKRSTDSLSFLGDDLTLDIIETENSKVKKSKTKSKQNVEQDSKQEQDVNRSTESLFLLEDDFTLVYSSKNSKIKKSKTKTNHDAIKCSKQEKDSYQSMESLSYLKDDFMVEDASKPNQDVVTKPVKEQNDKIKNKTKQINEIKDADEKNDNTLCKICNDKDNTEHDICNFLLNELTVRIKIEDGITDEFSGLYYHLIFKCNSPYCMVCKLNFYGAMDVITHLLSKEHKNNYKILLSEHFLMVDNNLTTCKVCNLQFRKEIELLHCEDIRHITKQEKYKRQLIKMNA